MAAVMSFRKLSGAVVACYYALGCGGQLVKSALKLACATSLKLPLNAAVRSRVTLGARPTLRLISCPPKRMAT